MPRRKDTASSVQREVRSHAERGHAWHYNPSGACHNVRNSRVAFGGIIARGYCAVLRQIAVTLGRVYEPGTLECGLSGKMAAESQHAAN